MQVGSMQIEMVRDVFVNNGVYCNAPMQVGEDMDEQVELWASMHGFFLSHCYE